MNITISYNILCVIGISCRGPAVCVGLECKITLSLHPLLISLKTDFSVAC